MSGRAERGLEVPLVLRWMTGHGEVLRAYMAEEDDGDDAPAGDPAVRAHLRFAACALEATAAPDLAAELEGLADGLPRWFEEEREVYERHLDLGEGAIALEEHLQFRVLPGTDPSLDATLHRRLRIDGWVRMTLLAVEARLGPAADGLATQAHRWIGQRSGELTRLIVTLDREAKARAARADPGRAADLALQDEIGQVATVQANVRMMVQALAASLAADPPAPR